MVVLIDKTDDQPIRRICSRHENRPDTLLEILHDVQHAEGFIGDGALRTIADALNISRAEIYGVISFYHDFRRKPPARHVVKICRAEACQAVGSEALAAYAEAKYGCVTGGKSPDGQIGLKAVYCLGNCALGPAVMIGDELYGRVTPERLDGLTAARLMKPGPS